MTCGPGAGEGPHSSRGFGVVMWRSRVGAVFDAAVPDPDGIRRYMDACVREEA